jgi:quinol monooxygenase YgiN
MYGTVARMRFKPGMAQGFFEMTQQAGQQRKRPGSIVYYVYQMDKDPNDYYLVVIFESKEAYVANANSQEQNQDFMQMMQFLESEPDGTMARSLHRGLETCAWLTVTRLYHSV